METLEINSHGHKLIAIKQIINYLSIKLRTYSVRSMRLSHSVEQHCIEELC